jgi:hypothetical protein
LKKYLTFEDINPHWRDWRPVPSFKQFDERWTGGCHDPVTGARLPYDAPKHQPDHFIPPGSTPGAEGAST